MRLNQYLARAGFGSRRACEELILEGSVTINGHRLRELATRVDAADNVLVHGKPVKMPLPLVAILHKPPGYLCTSPEATKERTIYDLLPTGWPRVVYVGRLDKEFDFALAPKMKKGVSIEEGFARMEDIYRVGPRTLKVVLTQGLKRQIREMFFKFGYEVKRLVRIQIGNLSLENLPAGQHRVLTQDDVKRYFPSGPGARPVQKRPPTKISRSIVKTTAKKEKNHV